MEARSARRRTPAEGRRLARGHAVAHQHAARRSTVGDSGPAASLPVDPGCHPGDVSRRRRSSCVAVPPACLRVDLELTMRAAALDDPALDVLHDVADEVARRFAAATDWGFSGAREGQYAIDVDVDAVAVSMLLDAGFAVLSEESGRSGDGDRLVVVDPLDGSTNASRGIPWFATSLCVVDDAGPSVALVVNQATGERLEAVRGRARGSVSTDLSTSGLPPRRDRHRHQRASAGGGRGDGGSSAPSAPPPSTSVGRRRPPRRVGRHV